MYEHAVSEAIAHEALVSTPLVESVPLIPFILGAFFFLLVWYGTPVIEWIVETIIWVIHTILSLFGL